MTQIHDPGEIALELRAHRHVERLPRELIRQALLALDSWTRHEDAARLKEQLTEWTESGSALNVSREAVAQSARQLAVAAHEVDTEEANLGRHYPSTRGRVVDGGQDQVTPISALVVLSLALQRFAMLCGVGAEIVRPGTRPV